MKIRTYKLLFSNLIHILNDSMFKMASIFYLLTICGLKYRAIILSANSIAFAAPYIIAAIPAGKLIHFFNAKIIMIGTKVFEIITLILIIAYSYFRDFAFTMDPLIDILVVSLVMMLLGIRTCIFVPCRYFVINHMYKGDALKTTTSMMSISSYGGMLLGIISASVISGFFDPKYYLVFATNILLSFLGFLLLVTIDLPEITVSKEYGLGVPELMCTLLNRGKKMVIAIIANAFFMGISIFYQMNTISYAIDVLHFDETYSGYLYFCVGVGMACGIVVGRFLCKMFPKNYFIIAGTGCALLGCIVSTLYWVQLAWVACMVMFASGIAMGVFIIPVEIFIQGVCPKHYIPLISSICSFVGFIAALFAAALIYGAAHFKVNTQELFAVSGMASVLFGIIITFAGEATIKKMEL